MERPDTRCEVDLGSLTDVIADDPNDRTHRLIAVVVAVVVHVGLLSLNIPINADPLPEPEALPEERILILHHFTPPPPPPPPERSQPVRNEAVISIPMPPEQTPEIIDRDTTPPELPVFTPPDVTDVVYRPAAPMPTHSPPETIQAFSPPEIITKIEPTYPPAALLAGVEGTVILEMTIDEHGRPIDIQVLRGRPMGLTQAAVDAARQWRFEPCTSNGKPARVQFTLTVRFTKA